MNEVSLTGCFLNDIQSPEKVISSTDVTAAPSTVAATLTTPSNIKSLSLVASRNENSRDSIFLNVYVRFCAFRKYSSLNEMIEN